MIELNTAVLECLADYINAHLGKSPEHEEIRNFIEPLLNEKDIIQVYNARIITQDEVCIFIYEYLFRHFIWNWNDPSRLGKVNSADGHIELFFHEKLKRLFFDS